MAKNYIEETDLPKGQKVHAHTKARIDKLRFNHIPYYLNQAENPKTSPERKAVCEAKVKELRDELERHYTQPDPLLSGNTVIVGR